MRRKEIHLQIIASLNNITLHTQGIIYSIECGENERRRLFFRCFASKKNK